MGGGGIKILNWDQDPGDAAKVYLFLPIEQGGRPASLRVAIDSMYVFRLASSAIDVPNRMVEVHYSGEGFDGVGYVKLDTMACPPRPGPAGALRVGRPKPVVESGAPGLVLAPASGTRGVRYAFSRGDAFASSGQWLSRNGWVPARAFEETSGDLIIEGPARAAIRGLDTVWAKSRAGGAEGYVFVEVAGDPAPRAARVALGPAILSHLVSEAASGAVEIVIETDTASGRATLPVNTLADALKATATRNPVAPLPPIDRQRVRGIDKARVAIIRRSASGVRWLGADGWKTAETRLDLPLEFFESLGGSERGGRKPGKLAVAAIVGGTLVVALALLIEVLQPSPPAPESPSPFEAVSDEVRTKAGTPVRFHPLANDLGTGLRLAEVGKFEHGEARIVGDDIEYTPAPGYVGTDQTYYTIAIERFQTSGLIHIVVAPAAAEEKPASVRAVPDQATTNSGTPVLIPVLANDVGSGLSIRSISGFSGAAKIVGDKIEYTPAPGFLGVDRGVYEISGPGGTDHADILVEVRNRPPRDASIDVQVIQGKTVTFRPAAATSDPEGRGVSLVSCAKPSHGTVTTRGDDAVYAPASGFVGADAVECAVRDPDGGRAAIQVTIKVAPAPAPVADGSPSIADLRSAAELETNFDKRLALLKAAMDLGDSRAALLAGRMFDPRRGAAPEAAERAAAFYDLAVERGDSEAGADLGALARWAGAEAERGGVSDDTRKRILAMALKRRVSP